MSLCLNCRNPTDKYRCPNCQEPYCSLECYKEHKKQECEKVETDIAAEATERFINEEPTLHDPFNTDDTVPREKLEQLKDSEGLRNLLYNPHLRNLLQEIDVAPNAWQAMRLAMQLPLFVEFADACLTVVEPETGERQT